MDLNSAFYLVIGAAVLLYVALDGFDLGVGILHLFARTDEQRRTFLNSIGPVWDGNEVWIIIVVGGLFAGFPNAYATALTGFYTLFTILIAGFIFRAVAIEFRSKHASLRWRSLWDLLFSLASMIVAFDIGLILGNLIQGVSLDAEQNVLGTSADLFRPYSILIGFLAIALCAMHGAIYLYMKTEGAAHRTVRKWINPAILSFVLWFFVVTLATLKTMPHMVEPFKKNPLLLCIPLLSIFTILNIPLQVRKGNGGWAFISSCMSMVLLLSLYHIGMFPYLIYCNSEPAYSLTIYNAASSQKTLGILLLVAAIGLPLVLAYGFLVYRIFRGKVKIDPSSY